MKRRLASASAEGCANSAPIPHCINQSPVYNLPMSEALVRTIQWGERLCLLNPLRHSSDQNLPIGARTKLS